MQKTTNSTNKDRNFLKDNFYHSFLYIDNISNFKKIKQGTELCIIETDFDKSDFNLIKKLTKSNINTEFWICTNNLSRENILLSNKIGVKTVISSPFDKTMVEDFFNNRNKGYSSKNNSLEYDYSNITNSKILIVDDNPMNIELLEEILDKFNIEIKSCLKPKEAHKIIAQEKFDLFLFDVMMPEMSGFELAKRIKEIPHNQNTPIIFISALSDTHNKIKGYNLGSFAYIEKPFDVNILRTQIFNILKNQKAREIINSNREDFLATVTHDLKTPVRAGINALNLLLNKNFGKLQENQQEIVEDLLNSTKYMQDMIENILCRNKIENDSITLSKQVHCLKEVIIHCIDITKYILDSKKQKINLKCEAKNTLIPIDFLEMKRAIHNLIANASEYSPIEGEIFIKIFTHENNLAFFVQDKGRGINLENPKDVFLQYMTLAKENKTVGSGLGLYITKKIIDAHNGKIILDSEVGEGTKITVQLPIYTKE